MNNQQVGQLQIVSFANPVALDKPGNTLFSRDNVVITPHAAYYSEEAIRTVRDFAAHEVVRVLTGEPPLSPVNAAQLAIGSARHLA